MYLEVQSHYILPYRQQLIGLSIQVIPGTMDIVTTVKSQASLSHLEAHAGFLGLSIKGIFFFSYYKYIIAILP